MPGSNSIPKRWEALYLNDVVVHAFLEQYRRGTRSWVQVMEELAQHQTERAMRAEAELASSLENQSVTTYCIPRNDV